MANLKDFYFILKVWPVDYDKIIQSRYKLRILYFLFRKKILSERALILKIFGETKHITLYVKSKFWTYILDISRNSGRFWRYVVNFYYLNVFTGQLRLSTTLPVHLINSLFRKLFIHKKQFALPIILKDLKVYLLHTFFLRTSNFSTWKFLMYLFRF